VGLTAHFHAVRIELNGTNDVPFKLAYAVKSITVYADSATQQIFVRPSPGSDFHPLNNGAAFTYEPADGEAIDPTVLTLRSSAAVTAYVVIGERRQQ